MEWKKIKDEYETTDITLKDLAEKHDIKLGTLKSRKSRDAKDGNPWTRDATKKEKVATIEEVAKPKKTAVESEEVIHFDEVGDDGLTDKQRLFCMYYVKTFNQTVAAIKAGYTRDSAHVQGSRLLRNDKVVDEIKRLKGELRKGLFIDAMDVLEKYVQIAFADITDFVEFGRERVQLIGAFGPVTDDNNEPVMVDRDFVKFKEYDEVDGTLITEIKMGKDGVSVKLADKMKALDFLSKHMDLLNENERKQLQVEQLKFKNEAIRMDVEKQKREEPVGSESNKYAYMTPEQRREAIERLKGMNG